MNATVIRNVRPLGAAAVDVVIESGAIAALVPAGGAPANLPPLVDGAGQLLLPGLVESHIHLDKSLWGQPWRPNTAGPTRNDRITNEQVNLPRVQAPIAERASAGIEQCIARGSLAIRSHVDVQTCWGIGQVEGMVALRERYRTFVDLQLVAFPQGGMLIRPGTVELMREALALGVDQVGGIDPAGIDRDPIRHLETLFALAAEFDRGVDIHLHDPGDLGRFEIERIADLTESSGRQGRVVISHAYCLGTFAQADLAPLADRLAALGISIMTCAPPHTTVPPVAFLRSRGVNVCSGSDSLRDMWSPMGTGDMLERAMLIALRYGWSRDEDLAAAFDIVSQGGAKALGLARYGIVAGAPADLVLLPAETLGAAVVDHGLARTVIRGGRVIARGGVFAGL